jgi:DNA-binding MarR family transcriptional regulator
MKTAQSSESAEQNEFKEFLGSRIARLKDADDITLHGYVQMPRVVLYSRILSDADKITHLLLLSFSWQEAKCFPKQVDLREIRGRTARQMRRNLSNLATKGFINIINNGSARANTYEVLCRVAKGGHVVYPARGAEFDVEFQDGDDFSKGGFVQVPVVLLKDRRLNDGAILTYSVLADQGKKAPSQQVMADQRGIGRAIFNKHVNELVKKGYLEVRKESWGATLTYVRRLKFKKPVN